MSILPSVSTKPRPGGRWAWMQRQAQEQRARAKSMIQISGEKMIQQTVLGQWVKCSGKK